LHTVTDQLQPKYRQILDQLTRDIVMGLYVPGQRFPSEAALVKRFGASRITVGHALRELQGNGFIDRVAGSGSYVRERAQERPDGPLFGLVIPNLGETEIFGPICRAIAAAPISRGQPPRGRSHALLWPHAEPGPQGKVEEAVQLAKQCVERGVSGVFFAPLEMWEDGCGVNRRVLDILERAGVPVVLLDRRPGGSAARKRCDLVGIDNRWAGSLATRHLIELGARRIAFVAYQGQATTVEARMQGYRDALGEPSPRLNAHMIWLAAREKVEAGRFRHYDGLVCANDRIAGRVMQALLARGVRIPQDVRMVGIDDVNYAALLPVPLTTVHQPCREIGEAALRMMFDRIEHPRMPAREVWLDCWLVVRDSCGAERPTDEAPDQSLDQPGGPTIAS
jgi:GntR family transcriptional regulator, arabinose operon transcriptional repressor